MSALTPSREQQAILDLGLTSIRVRAGAGTGKTTTVAMIIANLIESHGIEPEQILGITFTNKAAAELADRVRRSLGTDLDPGRQIEVHTYHGFAAQILFEFGGLAGVDPRSRVITPTFSRQLLSETFHHRNYDHLDITNVRTLDKIRALGDRLGDHLVPPESLLEDLPGRDDDVWLARREIADTLIEYNEDKRRVGVVDYSDLVTLSTQVMQEHPHLAEAIRDRYRVVVLDEYQDTNPAQRVLLTSIFTNGFPVIAVGDEDQTIYEWRGASAENFGLFPEQFPTVDGDPARESTLRLNRRSVPEILAVANSARRRANPESDDLVPEPGSATGSVTTYWAEDALQEADWVANQFEALHDQGEKWRSMAVLLRKNKDFAVVIDAFMRHDIPVEVANVGGLLSVPEVSELRSWLTILQQPEDSASLTNILFGTGFRLGMADIAPLSRAASGNRKHDEDEEEPTAITLLEAVEGFDGVGGLREQARIALQRFNDIYRELLVESQGLSLVEIVRLILDRTRAWQNIESLPPSARLTARLNVYRFLDLAESWSPLQGRPSLLAFLEYLRAMEAEPAEELDSAHLSGEDAVTLVTVHRAKGLEWETVAIPTVTQGNFPSSSRQYPDPERFPEALPPALRIDSVLVGLPEDEDERKAFLRASHYAQEWRVAYVALTRAKRRLLVSGAYWYGLPEPTVRPKKPSELFELVEGHEASQSQGRASQGGRPEVLRSDPRRAAPDPLFPDGWAAALRATGNTDLIEVLAAERGLSDEYGARMEETRQRLFELADPVAPAEQDVTRESSVTGLVTYARCPKRYFWSEVDPLPRRRNPAALRGIEVHRRIELHQRGQVPFEEVADDFYDSAVSGDEGEPGGFKAYMASRFATRSADLVEARFTLDLEPALRVRGRIDAVYAEAGNWEIVDFKSGRPTDDPANDVQLQAYAVAAREVSFGIAPPVDIDVTFAFLGGGLTEVTTHADEKWMAEARTNLTRIATEISGDRFPETPGKWCQSCDFLPFCGPGQEFAS